MSSNLTTAISHYDGIFKFVHTLNAKQLFVKAREKVTEGDWQTAFQLFNEAKRSAAESPEDVATIELVLRELKRKRLCKIPDDLGPSEVVDWLELSDRKLDRLDEEKTTLPQGLFFLKTCGFSGCLIGRKLVSDLWISNLIPELFCSIVQADMLLGLFYDMRVTENKYTVFYHPLGKTEKLTAFRNVAENPGSEIVYPFPLLKAVTKREFGSPEEGWPVDDNYDVMLSHGEEHFRQLTVKFVSSLSLTKPRFYDPACSTGVFLASLKAAFPDSWTIGQDLSQQMTDASKSRVDEVHCGNAIEPKIDPGSADVVFVRFLNSEVVRCKEAENLLDALLPTVRSGGHMVLFGHTPVLLSSANFKTLDDFCLLSSIGVTEDETGIYQYYILKRN